MIRGLSSIAILLFAITYIVGCEPTGLIEDLGTLGGDTFGFGINEAGNVTGTSYLSPEDPHGGGLHAFRYIDGLGIVMDPKNWTLPLGVELKARNEVQDAKETKEL